MDTETVKDLQKKYLIGTYSPSLILVKGRDFTLWDSNGKEYLDFTSGISVCNLGHCHPGISAALQKQSTRLVHVSNVFMNENQPELASIISKKSFGGQLFFANSGAEANEGMIKFARKWGSSKGKYEVVYMTRSFHGRSLATLSATDKPTFREGFGPSVDGFIRTPFNDTQALERVISEKTVAIMLEPIQGEGGVRPATRDFIMKARELCDKHNLLLLFDEIQCGMGRTGRYFAYQHYQIEPDAMSMAKALGNGYPIGAFEIQRKWAEVLGKGSHASTFGGSPLACAAAIAVFDIIEKEDILFNCRKIGEFLKEELIRLTSKYDLIKEIRGKGLMLGLELNQPAEPIIQKSAASGLLILSAGENVIRLLPPLTIGESEVNKAVRILDCVLRETV